MAMAKYCNNGVSDSGESVMAKAKMAYGSAISENQQYQRKAFNNVYQLWRASMAGSVSERNGNGNLAKIMK
jgi:hypothetical protein